MISKIENKLKKEILNTTKIDKFNRDHIFYDLKEIIIDKFDNEVLMDLYYCFFLYEKCLDLCRDNKLSLAKTWFLKIEQIHSITSKKNLEYLQLLYIPCLAFYYYKKEEYDKALELLEDENKFADLLLENNNSLKAELKLEQFINEYRVLIESGDYDNSILLVVNILKFLILNDFTDVPIKVLHLKSLPTKDLSHRINYLIDSIVDKIHYNKKLLDKDKERMYYNIFDSLTNIKNENFKYLNSAFQAIKYYHENDKDKFLKSTCVAFECINILPINIQKILLNFLIKEDKLSLELYEKYSAIFLKK